MIHRFGSTSDTCVDNFGAGGVAAGIDIETGELMQAFTIRRKKIVYDQHPKTKVKIAGAKIPDWHNKKRQIDALLQEINYLDYGGLDIAFTNEGMKAIEINKSPSLLGIQFSEPALIDPEFVEFLKIRGFERKIQTKKESR